MGVKKVTELTEEQKAMMPVWAEKWTKIGLSCEPADRETWVEGARGCYKAIGLDLPKVIWFANPRTLVKTCPTLATAYDLIGDKVVNSEEEFDVYVKQAMGMESKYSWSDYIGGQFWAAWVAFETFFREVVELEYEGDLAEKAEAYAKTVKSAGWWWPHAKFVGVSERPKEIHLEDAGNQKRLHCGNGPAISWRATEDEEEFGIYFWHGVNVPKDWIMNPKTCSVQEILKEENVEKRRAGCEIISWDRILAETPHRVIDEDADPEIGTLVAMDLPDSPNEYFLRVRCGTGRSFALCVPNQAAPGVPMKTAKQANAWTYGLDQDELHPEVRT